MDLNELKAWLIARIKATEDPELLQKLEQLLKASEPYAFEEKEPLMVAEPEVLEQTLPTPSTEEQINREDLKAILMQELENAESRISEHEIDEMVDDLIQQSQLPPLSWNDIPPEDREAIERGFKELEDPANHISWEEVKARLSSWQEE